MSGQYCYKWKYSTAHQKQFKKIHELEAINIIVAFRTLSHLVAKPGDAVTIWTDNLSLAFALETGKTKDSVLGACSQELWLLAATKSQQIYICHKPGSLILLSDALSRCHEDSVKAAYAEARITHENLIVVPPNLQHYVFFNPAL